MPETKTNRAICQVLYEEGLLQQLSSGDVTAPYAEGFKVPMTPDNVALRRIWVDLKYKDGEPVLRKLQARRAQALLSFFFFFFVVFVV